MQIEKGTSVAVVVNRDWANLRGVRLFLRQNQSPDQEIGGDDVSHIIFAKVLDGDDSRGLWVELNTDQHLTNQSVKRQSFLIPWNEVLTIVLAEKFSPAIWEEAKKTGFTAEIGVGV